MKRIAKTTLAAALLSSLVLITAGPATATNPPPAATPPAATPPAGGTGNVSCTVGAGTTATGNAQNHSTTASIKDRFDRFTKCTELGGLVTELAIWVGIGIILIVGSKALFTAAKTGAGIMTAIPTVLVAVLVGGLLINIDLTVGMFSWAVQAAQKAVSSAVSLLPST